jgi:hypothetical protein
MRTGNNPMGKASPVRIYLHGDEQPPSGEYVYTGGRGGRYYRPGHGGSGVSHPSGSTPPPVPGSKRALHASTHMIVALVRSGQMKAVELTDKLRAMDAEHLRELDREFTRLDMFVASTDVVRELAYRRTLAQHKDLPEQHLIHSTPAANLEAILRVGLLTDKGASNFSISKPGVVYLSQDDWMGQRMTSLVGCAAALRHGQKQYAVLKVRLPGEPLRHDPDSSESAVLVEHDIPASAVVGYDVYDATPYQRAYDEAMLEWRAECEDDPAKCKDDGVWVHRFSELFQDQEHDLPVLRHVDLAPRVAAAEGGYYLAPATLDTVRSLHAALAPSHGHDGLERHPVNAKHGGGGSIPPASRSRDLGGKQPPVESEQKALTPGSRSTDTFVAKHPGHADQSVHDPRSKQGTKRITIPKALRDAVLGDAPVCTFCGTTRGPFQADHIIPVKLGGKTIRVNLQPACAACNRARQAKDPSRKLEWIRYSQKQLKELMEQVLNRPRTAHIAKLWGDTLYLSIPSPANADTLRKHNTPRSPHRLHDPRVKAHEEARFKQQARVEQEAAGQVDRMDDEMHAAFRALGLRRTERVPVARGPLDRKAWNAIKRNIDAHLGEHAAYMTTDTQKLAKRELSRQLGLFIKTGLAKNARLLDKYMDHATDVLAYQELHAWRRQLGDHGVRHITEDQRMTDAMLRELGGVVGHVSARERLLASIALTYHDIGYTAKPARETLAGTKLHQVYSAQFVRQQPVLQKLLGKDMDRVCDWIERHQDADIDWAEDPVGSAIRLSDNLALFAHEKLPALFRYVPGAVGLLQEMATDLKEGALPRVKQHKARLRKMIDGARLQPAMKHNLMAAVDDIFELTPKFTLGMLAGHTLEPKFDGQTMHIPIQYSAFSKTLQDLFQMGQEQFIKLGDSYNLKPADVERGEFTFTNKRGIPVLHCKVVGAPTGVFKHLPGEHNQQTHGHRRGAYHDELGPREHLTLGQKRKVWAKLTEKYGDDPDFQVLANALAFFTQGFYDAIQQVGAAMATDTMEELEANAGGYFGAGLAQGKKDPLMCIAAMGHVTNVLGGDNEKDRPEDAVLRSVTYLNAQAYAHAIDFAIEQVEPTDKPLYRGIIVSGKQQQKLNALKPGDTFDIPAPTSFTRSRELGEGFIHGTVKGSEGRRGRDGYGYLLEVRGKNKAIDIDVFSTFAQAEAATNGRYSVVEVEPCPEKNWHAHKPPRTEGRIVLEQVGVVDSNFPKGAGVSYPLPKHVAKRFTMEGRYAVLDILSMCASNFGPPTFEDMLESSKWHWHRDEPYPKEEDVEWALNELGLKVGKKNEDGKRPITLPPGFSDHEPH